ncbi:hypothetical protein RDV84_00255 [Lysobacter yananisis]|uniref:Structural protein P5 n=1 Tax=Lysobacter yananisis TaxID=1003114 RepID=A0ABY9P8B4_9GAMM|nr:hypothetical protein [Lysobacter yananisis]WMT03322.1 hypothetical protein RDV84_00255 [Lysobacter yananisis]
MSESRGIRNNNPGNIDRRPENKWQGRMPRERMTPAQREENRFEVFATPAWGIRALAVLLINYFDRHDRNSVRKIVGRWAPPNENNTDAYVLAVARAVGVGPDEFVNLHEYRRLRPIVEAIITHENGRQPYSPDVIEEGLRLAGVVNPGGQRLVPAQKVAEATKAQAATAAALTAGAGAALVEGVGQVLPAVQSVNQVAAATSGLPTWIRVAAVLAVVFSVGASLYAWLRLRRARPVQA